MLVWLNTLYNYNDDENTDRNDSHDDDDDDDDDDDGGWWWWSYSTYPLMFFSAKKCFIRRPEKNSQTVGYNRTLHCFHR